MCNLTFLVLAAILMVLDIAAVEAASASPSGVEVRDARLIAKLNPGARAWLTQEAVRARALNTVSEAALSQTVRSAGSGLDLAGMTVEDAVVVMMMIISRDAREDMRQMLADMNDARLKEKATREEIDKTTTAKASVNSQLHREVPAQHAHPSIPRSPALDDFLASQRISYDSLSDMDQEQQRKMQRALDQWSKAETALSNIMKKTSDTESSIIRNIK